VFNVKESRRNEYLQLKRLRNPKSDNGVNDWNNNLNAFFIFEKYSIHSFYIIPKNHRNALFQGTQVYILNYIFYGTSESAFFK